MRRTARFLTLLFTLLAAVLTAPHLAYACGVERWDAKVLRDGTALTGPYTSSVAQLLGIAAPASPPFGRRTPPEHFIYTLHAELLGFRLEKDGDIHLVLAQPGDRSQTLIAEIPNPKCMHGTPQQYVQAVDAARLQFVRTYGIPPVREFRLAYQPITVTGPLLFDFEHGQRGAAGNDVEIHPVLSVNGTTFAIAPAQAIAHRMTNPSSAEIPHCPGDVVVFVNLNSGIYHREGSRWWNRLRHGKFMCRKAANAAGYRLARNEQ